MHKTVLVTDLQTRHPPFVHVRMISVSDMDRAPPTYPAFILVLEVLKPMEVVQIPKNRGVFTIDFKSIESFVSARITGGSKCRQGAILKTCQESAGIVDS